MAKRIKARHLLAAAIVPVLGLSINPTANAADKYWDRTDGTAGAGAPPSTGTWDTTATNWNLNADGSGANTTWAAGDNAFFSAGSDATGAYTVTVSGTQTAAAVTVKNGTVTLSGGVVDTGTNSFTISAGAQVNIASASQLNSAGKVVLDGGALKNTNTGNAGSFISALKTLEVTTNGGTVAYDDGSAANAFTTIYGGTITGTGGTATNGGAGTLIKSGIDEFRVQGSNVANFTFAKLVVNQGLYRLGATGSPTDSTAEHAFGAVPLAFLSDAITLNGGAIGTSVGTNAGTLNALRGVTIGANGGTLNGSGGSLIIPGAVSGSGKLIVTGANGITLNSASNVTTFTGALQADGLLTLNQSLTVTNLSGTTTGSIAVASGKTLTAGGDNASTTYAGLVSGSGAFTKTGTGTLTLLTKDWTNTGGVNINGGTIKFGDSNAGFGNSTVTVAATGTLDMNNIPDNFGALAGAGSVINAGNLGVGTNNASTTFSGTISGSGNLTKNGTGTLTITGSSSHTGATTIAAGAILANGATAQALAGTTSLAINGATSAFTLGKSNQVNDTAAVTLNGGTFNTAGFSEGSSDTSGNGVAGVGALTLAASSIIDLGSGTSILAFADSSAAAWTGTGTTLNVYNYTGTPDVGAGTDRLYFGASAAGLTPAQLADIKFFSDAGTTSIGTGAAILGTGEVVPTPPPLPEPASLGAVALGALTLLTRRRRRA
jgi:autotransporter-associated beta strand protein